MFYAISDSLVFLDIILTALAIALVGGLIYVFIISSLFTDRQDARLRRSEKIMKMEFGTDLDLWGTMLNESTEEKPKRVPLSKDKRISLIISGVSAVIIILLVIVGMAL